MLKGLIRWENLKDGHGNVLSYPDGNDSNAKLKAMSYLRTQLAQRRFLKSSSRTPM